MKKIIILLLLLFILVGCNKNDTNDGYYLFPSGLLAVEKDEKWGYMNQESEVIIDFKYDRASAFSNGTAIVKIGEQYQLIDDKGNEILSEPQEILYRDPYSGMIFYTKQDKVGLYSVHGKKLTEPLFDSIGYFNEGFSWFKNDGLFGLINDHGDIIIDATYDDAKAFKNGYAPVKKDGKWGAVDSKGNVVLDFEYFNLFSANEKGQMVDIETRENHLNFYDLIDIEHQEVLINEAYTLYANDSLYIVKDQHSTDFYYYDPKNGEEETIPYDIVSIFSLYAMRIKIDEVSYHVLLDENFEIVHQVESQYARFMMTDDFQDFVIEERRDGQVKIYALDQEESINIEASAVIQIYDDVIVAYKNGAYGVYDNQGEMKIDFDYFMIQYFTDGYFLCHHSDGMVIYNSDYQEINFESMDGFNANVNIVSWTYPND